MLVLTGGGTGGHLSIVKALCEECNDRGFKPIYIGSTNGQDKAWFEHHDGFEKAYFLQSAGVVNKKGLGKLSSLANIVKQAFICKDIFKAHKIKKVISVGGYSAAPASFGALMFQKELFIHEQNAVSGKLNKLLKPFCREFFSSFSNASCQTSYPVSKVFFDAQRVRKELKTILFLGGSQGARAINALAKDLACDLNKRDISIIHQCGRMELEELRTFYTKNRIKVDLFDFDKKLHEKMAKADFVISRAGASSLWELTANALPALFIPYPYAAKNHQYFNAKSLKDKNLALLVKEDEVNKEDVLKMLDGLELESMSKELPRLISQDGAREIIQRVLA